LVHTCMIYVMEGDIFQLSEAALKDLGIIPESFPQIGGNVLQGTDACRIEINGTQASFIPEHDVGAVLLRDLAEEADIQKMIDEIRRKAVLGDKDEEVVHIHEAPFRQPPDECDPKRNLPCSCPRRCSTDPPESLSFLPT
jgi:hypothetical protein